MGHRQANRHTQTYTETNTHTDTQTHTHTHTVTCFMDCDGHLFVCHEDGERVCFSFADKAVSCCRLSLCPPLAIHIQHHGPQVLGRFLHGNASGCLCACLCLCVCASLFLSVCLSVSQSVCLSVRPSVCLCVCLCVCLPACLPACLSVCLFVCLSVCLSLSLDLFLCTCGAGSWSAKYQPLKLQPACTRPIQAGLALFCWWRLFCW